MVSVLGRVLRCTILIIIIIILGLIIAVSARPCDERSCVEQETSKRGTKAVWNGYKRRNGDLLLNKQLIDTYEVCSAKQFSIK